jgi:hypothetical protein
VDIFGSSWSGLWGELGGENSSCWYRRYGYGITRKYPRTLEKGKNFWTRGAGSKIDQKSVEKRAKKTHFDIGNLTFYPSVRRLGFHRAVTLTLLIMLFKVDFVFTVLALQI